MRFSKLEIKGFKSFANETVIQFNEQVTGIVGPNGSGKSNIVDAIRWVLGEQKSSELRLEKNSNVIFNGSKSKKGSPYAQVTLVFENSANILPVEYSEVAITRELYRDGDSVYKLNNTVCRLKDITSLLTDTGIGSNTYAIIGFGMVEDLLNNKDNHRRTMIEQAAGITKFKHRKRETLNKLNSTLDDLEQVQNLLTEVESNMKIFQKQARRAERFNKLKSEYKGISTQLYWLQRASTTERSDSLNMQLQQAIRQYDQMEHTISEHEA
ncbi:MAG TPA: AAA family ATPase, partial [Saprospiraceae bacterium]|nr:AAA family ATPase [Saprospiraceae bacterium]